MLKIEFQNRFKKDYKAAIKRGCNIEELTNIISMLANEQPLPAKYKDHALINSKDYKNVRECHIQPDWLLIYQVVHETRVLKLIRTGTHSDLF